MGLIDRIQVFTVAALSTALMTCTSSSAAPEPPLPDQEATTGQEVRLQRVEGDVLDYAVQHSFYHRGRFSYDFIDFSSQTTFTARRYDSRAEFFIAPDDSCYVGVIHLANDHHEMDILIGDMNAFPDNAPGACRNVVHYREAGGTWMRLHPERHGDEIHIRGAPAHVSDDTALLMFASFLTLYNDAMQELRIQERILADYRSRQQTE